MIKYDYVLFDKIVAETIQQISKKIDNDKIILSAFQPRAWLHRYFYEISLITATIYPNRNIYINLDLPFFKYLLFKIKHWKNRKFIKRYKHDNDNNIIDIYDISVEIAQKYNVTSNIFQIIYQVYYAQGRD